MIINCNGKIEFCQLALNLFEYTWRKENDVGIIFSQDMDFQYAAERVKKISA